MKAPTYTTEQIETLRAMTEDKCTIEQIAAAVGKNTKSVIAKLDRMGLYVKPVKESKTGGVRKSNLADSISEVIGLSLEDADSLTKANKGALLAIASFLATSSQKVTEESKEFEDSEDSEEFEELESYENTGNIMDGGS